MSTLTDYACTVGFEQSACVQSHVRARVFTCNQFHAKCTSGTFLAHIARMETRTCEAATSVCSLVGVRRRESKIFRIFANELVPDFIPRRVFFSHFAIRFSILAILDASSRVFRFPSASFPFYISFLRSNSRSLMSVVVRSKRNFRSCASRDFRVLCESIRDFQNFSRCGKCIGHPRNKPEG